MAREPWRRLKAMIPPELIVSVNESQLSIVLAGDALIEFKSGDSPERLVSSGLDLLCIDECGLLSSEAWDSFLRPRLASPGRLGLAMPTGTPRGRNWFFRAYQNGQDESQADWWSLRSSTADNPMVSRAEITALRSSMSERAFSQEIEAAFLDDAGGVFRGVRQCIVPRRPQAGAVTIGIDFGKSHDRTVLVALDESGYVSAFSSFNSLSWSSIVEKVVGFIDGCKPVRLIVPEINSVGDVLVEMLKARLPNIRVEGSLTTSTSKRNAIERLAVAIEQRQISFPEIPQLVSELETYEFSESATGLMKFNAPCRRP